MPTIPKIWLVYIRITFYLLTLLKALRDRIVGPCTPEFPPTDPIKTSHYCMIHQSDGLLAGSAHTHTLALLYIINIINQGSIGARISQGWFLCWRRFWRGRLARPTKRELLSARACYGPRYAPICEIYKNGYTIWVNMCVYVLFLRWWMFFWINAVTTRKLERGSYSELFGEGGSFRSHAFLDYIFYTKIYCIRNILSIYYILVEAVASILCL